MELSEKLKGYLVNRLMDDLESARDSYQSLERDYESKVVEISFIKDNLKMKEIENVEKSTAIEDLEKIAANYEKLCVSYKELDEKNCELKKENMRLMETSDSWKEIYESNKLLDEKVESLQIEKEELELKIKDLERELLKKVIVECEPKKKGKPGRKPGVKK